mgnify:CR=1 FL=1
MDEYQVEITWTEQVGGTVKVPADSREDALKTVNDKSNVGLRKELIKELKRNGEAVFVSADVDSLDAE